MNKAQVACMSGAIFCLMVLISLMSWWGYSETKAKQLMLREIGIDATHSEAAGMSNSMIMTLKNK